MLSAHGLSAMRFLFQEYQSRVPVRYVSTTKWKDEFFFCLLGGYGITYELNHSAFRILNGLCYFDAKWYADGPNNLALLLERELNTRQFDPLTSSGEFRRYRYPRRKAQLIEQAGRWLFKQCQFTLPSLCQGEPQETRELLVGCPGIGYKTASWFLRNIGLGKELAILDVHVLRFLVDFDIIPAYMEGPSSYLKIEQMYLEACHAIGASPEQMDLILWHWSRGASFVAHD